MNMRHAKCTKSSSLTECTKSSSNKRKPSLLWEKDPTLFVNKIKYGMQDMISFMVLRILILDKFSGRII